MTRPVCLAAVITPFHLKVAKCLAGDERLGKPVHLILPTSFELSPEEESQFEVNRTFDNDFRSKDLRNNPLEVIRQQRAGLKALRRNLSTIFDRYADCQVIDLMIFNEKSALAQVAIHELARRKNGGRLIAADEGLAYYIEDDLSVWLKKLAYPLATWLLLGFRYQHFKRAGVHKAIDTVFMRYPGLISKKNKQYHKFQLSEQKQRFDAHSTKVLVLTSPFSEFSVMPEAREALGVKSVVRLLLDNGYEVVIKPHPFERPGKFSELKGPRVTFAPGQAIIEEMNLTPFLHIVNFGSSAVIDVLDRGFPRENIITYMLTKFDAPFFESLKIARNEDELAAVLRATAQQSRLLSEE